MASDLRRLTAVRRGGSVRRCHTLPIHGQQLVGQHSWGVAVIITLFHPEPPVELLSCALFHDVPEFFTGDVTAPAKLKFPELSVLLHKIEKEWAQELGIEIELTEDEKHWLHTADTLDLFLFCRDQVLLGNKNMFEVAHNCLTIFDSTNSVPEELVDLILEIEDDLRNLGMPEWRSSYVGTIKGDRD